MSWSTAAQAWPRGVNRSTRPLPQRPRRRSGWVSTRLKSRNGGRRPGGRRSRSSANEQVPPSRRLEEAVVACRAALEERTRERVPLDWATTQNGLGNALPTLGERESGTARLEEAVVAYRAGLEEGTRERVPLSWAMSVTGAVNPRIYGEAGAGEDKGAVEAPGLFNGIAIQSDGLSVVSSV